MRMMTLLAFGLVLGGCASVTRGWEEVVHFSSLPTEAAVRTSTGFQCITPCIMKVQRKEDFVATFTKQGYIPVDVPVRGQVSGAGGAGFAGNVLLGGVVGGVVDVASGAALDHCPNPVSVTLRRVGSREPQSNPAASCNPPVDPNGPVVADRNATN
jgi:hypothetical protein